MARDTYRGSSRDILRASRRRGCCERDATRRLGGKTRQKRVAGAWACLAFDASRLADAKAWPPPLLRTPTGFNNLFLHNSLCIFAALLGSSLPCWYSVSDLCDTDNRIEHYEGRATSGDRAFAHIHAAWSSKHLKDHCDLEHILSTTIRL